MNTLPIDPEIIPPQLGSNIVLRHEIAPLVAQLESKEQSELVAQRIAQFELAAVAIAGSLALVNVIDQESYSEAAEQITKARVHLNASTDFFEPIRVITYDLYQMVLSRKKLVQSSVEENLKYAASQLVKFEREQGELRQAETRRLQEEARKQDEERRLQAAVEAEKLGMDQVSVDAIIEQTSYAPPPIAPPTFQRAAGVGTRDNWCAEVTDLWALVKAVAKNKALLPLLEANMPALNSQAKSLKQALAIPGVRAVNKGGVAVRGAR